MKLILLLSFSFAITTHCRAQDEKHLVEAAVLDYVDAFYFGDTAKIARSISPVVIKHGYFRKRDSTNYIADTMTYQQMLDYALSVKKRNNPNASKLEKKIEVFDQQNKTAAAKLTAWWGTDYILLSKLNDRWMITHVLWQSPAKK